MSTPTEREREARFAEAWEKVLLLKEVRDAQWRLERVEVRLRERVREAAAVGVSERDLAEASGLSRAKVRRIIGRD